MDFPKDLGSLQELLNRLPQAKIARGICVVLLCYIAYLAATFTWLLVPQKENLQVIPTVPGSTVSVAQAIDVGAVKKLNLFGIFSEQKVIEPVQVQEAPETKLRLTLSGAVASNDPSIAAAIIENNGKQETYGIGDKITGTRATLHSVAADRVLIKVSGRLETLMLDGFKYTKVKDSRQNNRHKTVTKTNISKAVVDQRNNQELSLSAKQLRNDLNQDPGKISDYLKIAPKRQGGSIVGFRLMPGKKPEFFKSAGLKSGDVAVQMNGLDLTIPSDAARALQTLKEENEISLLIDRNGTMTEILFSIQ